MLAMRGNEKAIHQLTAILLDNALKYSPKSGTVSLTLEQQGKTLRLTVRNTTENTLPREDLNLLFERFYRAGPSRSSETGGHGIGLSMAKAIVKLHGGKLQASAPDEHSLQIMAAFVL